LVLKKQRGKGAPKKKRSREGMLDAFVILWVWGVLLTCGWGIAESKKMKGKKKPVAA